METMNFEANASHVGATEQLVNGKSVVDQTNESISTEQENYAQNFHQNNKNMEEPTTPTLEQGMANAQSPTAEGGICQQPSVEEENPAQPDFASIYKLSDLESKGYAFGTLSINRDINEVAVNAKMRSIQAAGGVICPCLICTAQQCIKADLSVTRSDGTEVASGDKDVNNILVIIDGQHRHEAVKRLNKKLKEGEAPYECYYYFPQIPNPCIIDLLREANIVTKPWKGGDYLTNLILTAPKTVDCQMLLWVQARYGTCGDVASWLWATLDSSRIYLKAMLIKASKSDEELKKVADDTDFIFGKKLYEAAHSRLSIDMVKLKIVPKTFIDIMKGLTASISKTEATEKLCDFINSLSDVQVKELQSCKRTATSTKDQQIENKLKDYWKTFYKAN